MPGGVAGPGRRSASSPPGHDLRGHPLRRRAPAGARPTSPRPRARRPAHRAARGPARGGGRGRHGRAGPCGDRGDPAARRRRVRVSTRAGPGARGPEPSSPLRGRGGRPALARRGAPWDCEAGRAAGPQRFGQRQHYGIRPWSSHVEVHWGRARRGLRDPGGPTTSSGLRSSAPARHPFEDQLGRFPETARAAGGRAARDAGARRGTAPAADSAPGRRPGSARRRRQRLRGCPDRRRDLARYGPSPSRGGGHRRRPTRSPTSGRWRRGQLALRRADPRPRPGHPAGWVRRAIVPAAAAPAWPCSGPRSTSSGGRPDDTPELVVLLDTGRQRRSAPRPRATVHHAHTPLHLAFSAYLSSDRAATSCSPSGRRQGHLPRRVDELGLRAPRPG